MSLFKRTVWALALILIATVIVGNAWVSYRNTSALAEGMAASERSRDALNALDDELQGVINAETGQRGYLLTQNPADLEPYLAAQIALGANAANLRALVAPDPAQLARLDKLEALIAQKFSELTHTVDLNRAGHRDEALNMVATNTGAATMKDIRATGEAMRQAEYALQLERDANAAALYGRSQFIRLLGMWIGLGLVLVAGILLRRDLSARARSEREIFLQREWFSTTLASIGDAVIVTDPQGRVQLLNPVAEQLTGWNREEATGRDLQKIFDIVNETTREPAENPIARALAEGRVVGLANHTVLRSRTGREHVIEDSAAPTYDAAGQLQGAVLVFHDATERRRSEIALSAAAEEIAKRALSALQAERTLTTILDNAPIGICMTGPAPDFKIVVLSRQMRDWIGAAESMPALAAYRKLLPDGRVPPADLIPLNRVMNDGQLVRDERWLIERNGAQPLTVIVNVAPVRDEEGNIVGAIHSWVDLTERQRLDHDLRVSQSRLRVLLESNVIGLILSFDGAGKVAQANRAFHEMLGFEPDGDAGERLDLVAQTPSEYRAADQRAFAELRRSGFCAPYEKEFISRADGRRVPVVVGYATVADSEGEFVGFALDISARKILEGKLRVQAEELLAADRRKDEFLAMLAHELRNPLSPLRNAIYLLDERRGDDKENFADLLPMMRRQIDHLVRLVDDLLDAARISQGKIAIEKHVIEVAPSITAAVESVEPLVRERAQHLEVDLGKEPLHICGDATRLMQMVANILHNAVKYTPRDGHVRLTLERSGSDVLIRVHDDGCGIAPELLPRIFDTFVQDDQSLARSSGGLGVGLALVRRLCDLHGGSVSATSAGLGQGSQFELRLPLVDAPVASASPKAQQPRTASPPLRVLVVDDNVDLAASTVALLELWGHEVREVHDGHAVLGAALPFHPDVILLDIGLPGMDGYEVARLLSTVEALEATQVIAMTGYGQERDRQRSAESGFDAHLVKPVEPAALKALLDRFAG